MLPTRLTSDLKIHTDGKWWMEKVVHPNGKEKTARVAMLTLEKMTLTQRL